MKKPLAPQSKQRGIPRDMDLLQRLDDPALRAVFGQIIAERNKLKRENHILKNNAEINIDIRPNQVIHAEQVHQGVAVLPALNGLLLPSEIEALEDAINEQKIIQRGWTVSKYGAVKDEHERPLFKNGFVIAIKKVLDQV